MAVHCLEIITATNYDAEQARSDLQTYRANHNEVLSVTASDLRLVTECGFTDTGENVDVTDHYRAQFRFAWNQSLNQLRNAAETWLNANFDWWAWRYHECEHDATTGDCSAASFTTNTSGNVPQDVINCYT